jgi:hypothetical protein
VLDVNGDGRQDLLAATGSVWYVTQWVNGSYSRTATAATPNGAGNDADEVIRPADLNGDGLSDLLYGNRSADSNWYYQLNSTSGFLTAVRTSLAMDSDGSESENDNMGQTTVSVINPSHFQFHQKRHASPRSPGFTERSTSHHPARQQPAGVLLC